jgi:hypothetical protein
MSNTKTDTFPSTLQYEITFPALSINDLNWYDVYAHHRINVGDLQLDTLQIAIETYPTEGSKGFSLPHTYPFNPEKVASVSLQSLDMQNATIDLTMHKGIRPLQYKLKNTALFLKNLYMDSTVSVHPDNLFFAQNVHLQTEDIQIKLADSLQILELGKVGFITQDSTLYAKGVKLLPRFEKTALAPHLGYQKGWLQVESDSVFLKGVNLYDLLYNQKMIARKLGINDFIVNTFKDKNYPLPEDILQPTLRDFIINAPYYLKLDTIEMQKGQINVELLPENGEITGQLFFDNFQAHAFNVTNDPVLIHRGIDLGLSASANIMGKALLTANFAFDMQDENGSYVYTGSMGSIDMENFNPILEPIALVKIKRGKIDAMDMRIEANKYYAIGSMKLYYDNLRIAILDRNKDALPTDKSLLSFFANAFIVNANNPHFFILREGDIYAERDPRKAIFDHWARSTLSGIISSIGSGKTKKNLKQAQHDALKEQMQAVKENQENSENKE